MKKKFSKTIQAWPSFSTKQNKRLMMSEQQGSKCHPRLQAKQPTPTGTRLNCSMMQRKLYLHHWSWNQLSATSYLLPILRSSRRQVKLVSTTWDLKPRSMRKLKSKKSRSRASLRLIKTTGPSFSKMLSIHHQPRKSNSTLATSLMGACQWVLSQEAVTLIERIRKEERLHNKFNRASHLVRSNLVQLKELLLQRRR